MLVLHRPFRAQKARVLFAGVCYVVLFIVGCAVSSAIMVGALGLYMEPIWIYMAKLLEVRSRIRDTPGLVRWYSPVFSTRSFQ